MRKASITGYIGLLVFAAVFLLGDWRGRPTVASSTTTGMGAAATLEGDFQAWKARYERAGGDRNVVLAVGWFKGLSTEPSEGRGTVELDLVGGSVSAEIRGLAPSQSWDLWLVDNRSGRTVRPEAEDRQKLIGRLGAETGSARLVARLGSAAFADFEPDLAVVTRAGVTPDKNPVLVGTTTLFHRLYRGERAARMAAAGAEGGTKGRTWVSETLMPTARAQMGPIPHPVSPLELLIKRGRQVFRSETFGGNGRTCETCHRENNNFTIDPQFIASLPADDPLFVGEDNPDLGPTFENPRLLREFGLVLENVDGFDDLQNKFVMRGVPTLLSVSTSLRANPADGTTVPPNERLGYGGDGAPGTGTLREFATGAVVQHFTKSLNRVEGVDFRLPTDEELDALEAFQRSLGRQTDPDLRALELKSVVAARGQAIFLSPTTGKCFFCHSNGGATLDSGPGQGVNANFNIGVQRLPDMPADLAGEPNPPDAGFGRAPNAAGGFGIGSFNTLTVIEAADTGPFFHNNSIPTIEGAVEFYNSKAFNNSPIPPGLKIDLESTQVSAVASFLRVLNALENVRSTHDLASRAKAAGGGDAQVLLRLALGETSDAIDVLKGGILHPDAQSKLDGAQFRLRLAILSAYIAPIRNYEIDRALSLLDEARGAMVSSGSSPAA